MVWADKNPSVIEWSSEPFPIPYYSTVDGKNRRYYIDFYLKLRTKEGIQSLIIEVKPNKETMPPKKSSKHYLTEMVTYQRNCDKWKAAEKFANDNNLKFIIMDEYKLGITRGKHVKK